MKKSILLSTLFLSILNIGFSQSDSTLPNSITISGYVDGYFRSALNTKKEMNNNFTSFTNSNQQVQLGMMNDNDVVILKGVNKTDEIFNINISYCSLFLFSKLLIEG